MMRQLDSIHFAKHKQSEVLKVGWSKINIMHQRPMPLAGYGRRGNYENVHDSLYIRILSVDNGNFKAYLINADLLLFPPELKNAIESKMQEQGRDCEYIYLGATHTHNGIGGWDDSHLSEYLMGKYDSGWVEQTADQVLFALNEANNNALPAKIFFWEAFAADFVKNRLTGWFHGIDDYMRGLEIIREDSSKALMVTFSAHPTSINSLSLEVSADYPGILVQNLEKSGYNFSMFMAGAVASHSKSGFCSGDFELCEEVGGALSERIQYAIERSPLATEASITTATIPVMHGITQLRVLKNVKLRDWAVKFLNGPLKGDIRILKIGDILMIGTSNDFSGEILVREQIPAFANAHGMKIILTSFNGEYTGYITHDDHYYKGKRQEVTFLNWVGPYFGAYYTEILKKIIEKVE